MAAHIDTPGVGAALLALRRARHVGGVLALGSLLIATLATWYSARVDIPLLVLAALITGWLVLRRKEVLDSMYDIGAQARALFGISDDDCGVRAALETLPETYLVFNCYQPHDTDGRRLPWHIDHVVVGPTGVFSIDARCGHSGWMHRGVTSRGAHEAILAGLQRASELSAIIRPGLGETVHAVDVVPLVVYEDLGDVGVPALGHGCARPLSLGDLRHAIMIERPRNDLSAETLAHTAEALYSRLADEERRAFSTSLARFTAVIQTPAISSEAAQPAVSAPRGM